MKKIGNSKTNKKNRNNRNTGSQAGIKGTVGAPAKYVNWPSVPFTMATLASRNRHQCVLSLRTKLDKLVEENGLIRLLDRPQSKGGVGRPQRVYVVKDKFNADTMTKFGQTPKAKVKTPRKARQAKVTTAVIPAGAANTAINTETVTETAPVVNETAEVPAAPAPDAPAAQTETAPETAQAQA